MVGFRLKQGGKDVVEIVEVLKEFDGGFFGGFEGVVEKFEVMLVNYQGVKFQVKKVLVKEERIEIEVGKVQSDIGQFREGWIQILYVIYIRVNYFLVRVKLEVLNYLGSCCEQFIFRFFSKGF